MSRVLSISVCLLLALTLAIATAAYPSDDNTIILRLDDGQSAATSSPAPPPTVGGSASLQQVINVPAVAAKRVPKPPVKAASLVLMDANTGQVLYSKNGHVRRPNASTTKMLTAILLIENCQMTDTIKASKAASETPFTSIHLKPGEEISAYDLLMGLMVRSANDAAVAAAEHIGGSVPEFAKLMNRKAREIGCTDSNFVTPNGLYDKNHYSSAYDLCLIGRYGLQYPLFQEAISTRKYSLDSRTMNKEDLVVFSHCKFLKDYSGADGAKTGYIKQAGYCIVGTASRDGWRLLAAVLKSDNAGRDAGIAMDYGFANYQPYTIARADVPCVGAEVKGGELAEVPSAPVQDIQVAVPRTGGQITTKLEMLPIEAPIAKGTKVGTVIAMVDGQKAAAVELRAAQDVGISFARKAWWWMKYGGLIFAAVVVGRKCGTAFAKGSRRRRRRVTAPLRSFDRWR